jgi:hypothetical protein
MVTDGAQVQDWSRLIRAEYEEWPDLRLTQAQVEEWWGLDAAVTNAALDALVSAGLLRRTHEGVYLRA